jgi:small subunit ribosomal protein S21
LQVLVRDNNVDQALRVLKKKMQREGVFREMRQRKAYEKPSERKAREKADAIRRARKQARKTAIAASLRTAERTFRLPLQMIDILPAPVLGCGAYALCCERTSEWRLEP